ncbi:BfmA/BtgA family mobilization protein, partial [Flavobacterium psychrophilum]
KITKESKNGLEWLKKNYSFNTYSIAIDTAIQFFKNNNISPRERIYNNYSEAIFNFKNELFLKLDEFEKKENENTERIIKLNRRFELDYLKPINVKLFDVHKNSIDDFNDKNNSKVISNIIGNSAIETSNLQNIEENKKLNETIIKQENAIKFWKEQNEILEKEKKEYHRCMEKLNRNMKVEKTLMGKKPYINLSVEETEKLFYLIP